MNPPTKREILRNIREAAQQWTPPTPSPPKYFMSWRVDFFFNYIGMSKKSNLGTTPPCILPAKNFPFGCALASCMPGSPPRGGFDWVPPRDSVVVGIPPWCCHYCFHQYHIKKSSATGPVQSPFVSLPYTIVVSESYMAVFLIFDKTYSRWSLTSTPPTPHPWMSIRYCRGVNIYSQ